MSIKTPSLISGSLFQDERGSMVFCNEFHMKAVKRMYMIAPSSTETIRAWQGHRYEQKWFFCVSGAFEIKLVELDDFQNPISELPVMDFLLTATRPEILHIPGGFASGIKAVSSDSRLLVYSNFTVEESSADDFRYTLDTWNVWNI